MGSMSFVEMWGAMGGLARAVVFALAAMSMFSLYVVVDRWTTFARARAQSLRFVTALGEHLKARDLDAALKLAASAPQPPIARVVAAGLGEYVAARGHAEIVEVVDRALERVKERELAELRRGLGALASIASAAPFVGLFGTVVGIINAFHAMAESGQGGLASVSAGIAEALVAIPAVMLYNYFTNRLEDFSVDMNDVSSELVGYVLKDASPK